MSHPTNEHDLAERFDAMFDAGPPPPPLDDLLSAGRRAVRRRWLAATGAAAVVALAVGGLGGALVERLPTSPTSDAGAAAPPDALPRGGPAPNISDDLPFPLYSYDAGGHFAIPVDATRIRSIDNPAGLTAPNQSIAVVTRVGSTTTWTYAWAMASAADPMEQSITTSADAADVDASFEEWVADEVALNPGPGDNPTYVGLDGAGSLTARGDTRILDQTGDPGEALIPDGYRGSAGMIAVGQARLCVVSRVRLAYPNATPASIYLNASQFGPGLAQCLSSFGTWAPDVS